MRDKDLYSQILGIKNPWQVVDVELALGAGEVKVYVEHDPGIALTCPISCCQVPSRTIQSGRATAIRSASTARTGANLRRCASQGPSKRNAWRCAAVV